MKETKYGNIIATLVMVVLFMFFYTTVGKATQSISEMESEKKANEQQASSLQEQASDMKKSKDALQDLVVEMNSEVADLVENIAEYETIIDKKNSELESNEAELESAEQDCDEQYNNMKMRIQYMYEQGNTPYVDIILGGTFTDKLNQYEYTTKLMEYDRKMLEKYKLTRRIISNKKTICKQQQLQILELSQQLANEKKELDNKIKLNNQQIAQYSASIKDAEAKALEYEKKVILQQQAINEEQQRIEESKVLEAESIAKAKREEARRQRAIQASIVESIRIANGGNPEETTAPYEDDLNDYKPEANDLDMMAAILECEAGDQSYYGILCVGAVIMNRISSASFPNTLTEVLYQPYQFSPVLSGRFAIVLARGANAECYQAAREVLNDGVNVGGWHFFRMNDGSRTGEVIGDHVFY